jgi:amino acid permease
MTKLIILISIAFAMVGFAFYGLFMSNKRDDISNTVEDNWNTDGHGGGD